MNSNSKVFIKGRLVWLAWYPLRGRRCQFRFNEVNKEYEGDWHFGAALGPLYLGLGPGTPLP